MSEKKPPFLTGDFVDDEQVCSDVSAPEIGTNARRAGRIAPNGYRFQNGDELRLHLNEGGHVIINGQGKWYRMRANLLECIYRTGHEWQQSAWDLYDLAKMERVVACDEPQLSKDIRAREEADAERSARKFARKFDEESWPPFKEKQMLYRDDGNSINAQDERAMMFHIYNDQNRQVVFVMTCGEDTQSRSIRVMEAAKLHAALGVWLDQANREEDQRFANNNSQRVLASSNNTEENGDAAALYQIRDAIHHLADTLFDGFNK